MEPTYSMPNLKDLSQGSRITFVREFRLMSLNGVSEKLGLKGKTKTRYETGEFYPKEARLLEIAEILNVSANSIKEYKFKEPTDLIYHFMWLEESDPDFKMDSPITYPSESSHIIDKSIKE